MVSLSIDGNKLRSRLAPVSDEPQVRLQQIQEASEHQTRTNQEYTGERHFADYPAIPQP
jgi:hypothetical protein